MRYIGNWQTAAPAEPGVWHYVEPGSHTMNVCMVDTRRALLIHRVRRLVTGLVTGLLGYPLEGANWSALAVSASELADIAEELALGRESLEVLTTNRSHNAQGAPALDDLAPVAELERWWCNASVEPENGPPGFDTDAGAGHPSEYGDGR